MIGQTISHYRVLRQLGAGGMGVVYEAEDTRLGRRVAIKLLPESVCADPEHVQRFLREARAISSLSHPHICTLFDIGEHGCQQYMVIELLEGESLRERIARPSTRAQGGLPLDEVLAIGAELADALDAAHAKGIVHRDIKPANLFITRRGQLKVLDFGVAKLSEAVHAGEDTAVTEQLTTAGTTLGTVAYMSPEQARGQEIDGRSDIFSAGIVLYEMVTGRQPFPGATPAVVFEGLLTKQPPAPSSLVAGVPAELDHIVFKALEKDTATRYQSAREMLADIRRLRRDGSGATTAVDAADARAAAGPATAKTRSWVKPPMPPVAAAPGGGWRKGALIGVPLVTVLVVGGVFLYRSITTPALTGQDPVVLASMVNRTGDQMFDDTLGEALALQLRQSPFLKLVPDQQVQSTLRLMGRDASTVVDTDTGREVCQRVGAKALLGGTIASLGSSYLITLNAQDCVSGSVLAEEQAQADSKETVLRALGTAVGTFRERLGESLASIQRYDAKIEEATTGSLEALKAYSQGIRARQVSGDFDSVPFFRRAVELDPEFALAFARLGTVLSNLGQHDESKKMTARAYELRSRASESERLYIEARYFTTVQADVSRAIESYRLLLATYPEDYTALVNISLLLRQQGQLDEALAHLEHAMRVAPDQPLGWSNLGEVYLQMQRFEDAKRAYEQALKVQDSATARVGLFLTASAMGDQPLADQQVEAMRGRRDEMDILAAHIKVLEHGGRFAAASELIADWRRRMEQSSRVGATGEFLMGIVINEVLAGLEEPARRRMDELEDADLLGESTIDDQLVVAALLGDVVGATRLRSRVPDALTSGANPGTARVMKALLSLAGGQPAETVAALEPVQFEATRLSEVTLWTMAQLQLRHWAEAVKGLTYIDENARRIDLTAFPAYVLVSLGRAHAALGDTAAARKAYEAFFELWKDADADIPLLVQARQEFAKLGS